MIDYNIDSFWFVFRINVFNILTYFEGQSQMSPMFIIQNLMYMYELEWSPYQAIMPTTTLSGNQYTHSLLTIILSIAFCLLRLYTIVCLLAAFLFFSSNGSSHRQDIAKLNATAIQIHASSSEIRTSMTHPLFQIYQLLWVSCH